MKSGKAKVEGVKGTNWTQYDTEVDMIFDSITAPYGFGYHCSNLNVVMAKSQPKNGTTGNNETKVHLSIQGFQV